MASIEYVVRATDLASVVFGKIALSADGLDKQLEDLGKRVAEPEVDLKDAAFTQGIIRCAERIDKLSARMAEPGVDLNDKRFQAEIFKINAQLDRLDKRHVTATVDVKTDRSFLSRLRGVFPGGGGAAGAAGAAGKGGGGVAALLTGATPLPLQAIGIGAAAAGGAVLAPAAIPAAAGLGIGGLGALLTAPKAIGKDLTGALDAVKKALQPLRGLFTAVFAPLPGFVRTLAPMLRDLFRASVPYLQTFVKFMEQATKTLLPVFTSLLRRFQPDLPLIAKGLMEIVKGLAGFLNALGPAGMQASAKIFVAAAIAMEYALKGLGIAINWLAKNVPVFVHDIAKWWDWLRHHTAVTFDQIRHDEANQWDQIYQHTIGTVIRLAHNVETQFNSLRHSTANIFDGYRHDIAHYWDMIWNNTVGRVQRGAQDVRGWFDRLRHWIASEFDSLRHSIAAAWDAIWNNTIGRVRAGVGDVVGWFKRLAAGIWNVMRHLPGQLWNLAKTAIENIIKGATSVVPRITSFFSGFAHGIVSIFKKIWGWFSPSAVMYEGGKALMTGLEKGIKDHAHRAVSAAAGAAHQVANAGAGVQRWAALVRKALAMEGLSQSLVGNVLYQMQTESGGNPNAINLTDINAQHGDPSRGLMQVIMSTFGAYHWPGTSTNIYDPLANIAAALNYARHVYGPTLMSGGMGIGSGHGYATGSWNVPYTGPATVHQGEMIIPPRQAAAIRSGAAAPVQVVLEIPRGAPGIEQAVLGYILKQVRVKGGGDVQVAFGS